jgi:FKBP-type peptidyl-prolyl cis-trans isomerase SlyD
VNIGKDTVVSLTYELLGADGKLVEKTDEPISYLHGGHDGIFPLVEDALDGKQEGFACKVQLEPDDAFGGYEKDLVRVEPRNLFPASVKVGMQFEGSAEASGDTRIYTVTDISGDEVTVDGNHPLAGQTLVFSCVVTGVRAATGEELSHGHVHGAGGHHH